VKKSASRIIGRIALIGAVFGFMFYGIIQFWRTYCSGSMEQLDVFLEKDSNMLLVIVCIGMFGILTEITSKSKKINKKGKEK